ncbi:MAG TPA: beta-ketoacyl synthase N-terminal-like domain-containing protein, partial [Isosphaeraceae bacterium]|nr:beta-ketoacyl synthase N-terminal-like domain-containing protein [Isosphaeraceae bacterium]
MTTQTMPRIMALAPRGSDGLGVAAAACRARALGIIDLVADPKSDLDGLSAGLLRLTSQPFGIRAAATELQGRTWLWQEIEGLAAVWVVLDGGDDVARLGEVVEAIEHDGRIAIAEVTTRQGVKLAIQSGFSALIVAGNATGGASGIESALALLQGALAEGTVPVWVRGGIGPAVAADCLAAGAAGVVLDDALLLARESPLNETGGQCLPAGQDAALAEQLARKYVTVGGIVQAVERAMDEAAEPIREGETANRSQPSDVAIVGMAAVFPGAASAAKFWSNTLRGIDSIIEVPADHWDWRLYYDPDPKAPDKIVSKWGGFVPDIPFDPLRYGMPPSSLPSIEPAQMLALEVVRNALADAGYAERPFPRERTGVVLGMGGGAAQLAMGYAFRSYLPMLDTVVPEAGKKAIEACKGLLPEWTEDSFPGFLLNVTAGRIANRLNLGGANYTVDAACGSSLAAASLAVRELETGAADVVILGGVDTVQNPFTYLAFSKTQAFSHRG